MKALKKWLKTIALLFTALMLFQSCSTYKTPATLERAAQDDKAVKIITVTDETLKYKYIVYEDGLFYGVKDNPGEDVRFSINAEEVAEVLKREGGLPVWAWIAIGAVIGVGLLFLIAAISYANSSFNYSY
jgi:hypothetical protein